MLGRTRPLRTALRATQAAERPFRLYPDKALSVDCDIRVPTALVAEREDMLELFGTLLDNACK